MSKTVCIIQPGLVKYVALCTFCATPFYVSYRTFHRSFKEKCPLSGAKTQVKYVNLARFITLLQVHIAAVQNSNIRGLSLKVNAISCPTP